MSLMRTGFVVACGVALLPADKDQQQQVFYQASQAAGWLATYCSREPEKCEQAAGLWDGFKEKAVFAGQLALEASQTYAAGPALEAKSGSAPATRLDAAMRVARADIEPVAVTRPAVTRDTLTREDVRIAWRGSKAR
jgi:hypothetical protein